MITIIGSKRMTVFKNNNIKQNLHEILTLHFLILKTQMFGRQKTKLDEYEDKGESCSMVGSRLKFWKKSNV